MFDDLFTANQRYAATFPLAGLSNRASRGLALVTCMDTRIDPLAIFELHTGEAKIIRNAGGRATPDVLRSLVLAVAFLGVHRIGVLHHTDCALAGQDEPTVHAELRAARSVDAAGWDFLAMPDPDAALAGDVEAVRTCDLVPADVVVEGWRYDVGTGLVQRVVR